LLIDLTNARTAASQILVAQSSSTTDRIDPRIVENAGYITPAPTFLATIFHSLEERQHVAAADRVVIDAGDDKHLHPGMQLTIMRPATAVYQPTTSQFLGTSVIVLGAATVERVLPTTAIIRILYAFDAIQPGDFVQPFVAPQPIVTDAAAAPQRQHIQGTIIATKDDKVAVGLGDVVYIDRGTQHGVTIGDRFSILQAVQTVAHPVWQRTVELPSQPLGILEVIAVREHTATAFITASQREFAVGDGVELRLPLDDDQAAAGTPQESETTAAALTTQAIAYRSRLLPCLEAAHHAIRVAATAGANPENLAAAQQALTRAEALLEGTAILLDQGNTEQVLSQLRMVESDCLAAQELSTEARLLATSRLPAQPEQYRVRRGDTLWSISGQAQIYLNPLMWPILYKANRQHVPDPDRIFPQQFLAIPRHLSQEEISLAIQRARTRGVWRQGDGQDTYILEGIRR
jgi:nucleoid-associated protein YgaU